MTEQEIRGAFEAASKVLSYAQLVLHLHNDTLDKLVEAQRALNARLEVLEEKVNLLQLRTVGDGGPNDNKIRE